MFQPSSPRISDSIPFSGGIVPLAFGKPVAMIVPPPMGAGSHLHLVRLGKGGTEVVERQRGGWRVFSSTDAAANTANSIGFRRIEIDLSSR